MLRQVLSYTLIGLLFSSTIGLPAYTHICHTQSKTWSSLVIPAKSCCSKKKKSGEITYCHILLTSNQSAIKKRPCCEDELGLLQISSDFIQHESMYMPLPPTIALASHVTGSFAYSTVSIEQPLPGNKPHGPPLNPFGRSLLIEHQVFRC